MVLLVPDHLARLVTHLEPAALIVAGKALAELGQRLEHGSAGVELVLCSEEGGGKERLDL